LIPKVFHFAQFFVKKLWQVILASAVSAKKKEESDVHRYGTYPVEIGMCFQSSRGNWDAL
jgi:hypothetical protein